MATARLPETCAVERRELAGVRRGVRYVWLVFACGQAKLTIDGAVAHGHRCLSLRQVRILPFEESE